MNNLNITIGQYVKGDCYIYKLDPRAKIIATIFLMVTIFLIPAKNINAMYVLFGYLAFLLLVMITSRLNLFAIIKGLQPVLFIGLFTFVLQIMYNQTGSSLYVFELEFSWITILVVALIIIVWFFTSKYVKLKMIYMLLMLALVFITFAFLKTDYAFKNVSLNIFSDGLIRGCFFFLRLVLVIMLSTILTMTTSTTDINLGLEWILHPLTFIKIPVGEFAMLLSLTLRFIPTLLLETDKIMKAQASRGIDFNEGSFIQKIKQIVSLLIPMFVISINRAEDLANAMEARGYIIGAKRTSIEELSFKFKDYLCFLVIMLLFGFAIYVRIVL